MRNPAQNQDIDSSKKKLRKFFFLNFFTFRQLIVVIRVYDRFVESPDFNVMKIALGEVYFRVT